MFEFCCVNMSNKGIVESPADPNLSFDIFFQINQQEAFSIKKVDRTTYVKLKHDDSFTVDYIKNLIATGEVRNEDENIEVLFRSIDDVDYVRVNILSGPGTSKSQTMSTGKGIVPAPLNSSFRDIRGVQVPTKDTKSSKSEAWNHFKKIDKTSALCLICSKSIKYSGNTTNLMQHLRHAHPMQIPLQKKRTCQAAAESVKSFKRAKSVSVTDSSEDVDDPLSIIENTLPGNKIKSSESENIKNVFHRMSSFQGGGSSTAKITNAILYMIAVDHCPLSIVENKGFRALMKTTAPLYIVPSRRTITKELELKYEQMRNLYQDRLALETTHTLTCDIWTDTANQSYLGITNHYLTNKLELMNGCLGVFPLYERHTADYISENLKSSLDLFGIELSRVTAMVTDCGANIQKAAVDMFGASKHIPCLAHALSHVVPSALKTLPEIERIISRVKDIVTITKRSVVASDELKRLQICNGKTEGTILKLKQDVPTRWNSLYYMIERFLKVRDYIYPVLMKCPFAPEMLSREDIEILQDCILLFSPIENVVREISGETYSTGSMAIPIVRCMELTLTQCAPTTAIGKKLKSLLVTKIHEKFNSIETNQLLAISTILDPRFKKIHFQSALTAAEAIRKINNSLKLDSVSSGVQGKPIPTSKPSTSSTSIANIWEIHDT